jgi:hypothetical protein
MIMDKIKAEHEIKELLKQIETDLDDYNRRLEAIGLERREILRLFARRLEKIEVEKMQQRVNKQAYGNNE